MDFLRAIAILSVMLAHTVLSYGAPESLSMLQFGGTGVDLFFVLSGWLLGGQLFKELNRSQSIDVKRFWIRRWMRTLPAYYAVLCLTIVQLYLTKNNFSFPFAYLFFLQNYDAPLHFFSISWSLCVEEQFYLCVAPLLLFSRKLGKHPTTLLLVLLLIMPEVFRQLEWYGHKNETHVRLDGCVMGVMLANLKYNYVRGWQWLTKHITPIFVFSVFYYLFTYYAKTNSALTFLIPGKFILACMFGIWVVFANADHPALKYSKVWGQTISPRGRIRYIYYIQKPWPRCVNFYQTSILSGISVAVYYSLCCSLNVCIGLLKSPLWICARKSVQRKVLRFWFSFDIKPSSLDISEE